jgi:hypothetical protein
MKDQCISAIGLALAGDWDGAQRIVQDMNDAVACWIHAVLHKIEGDAWNSRYWYDRSGGRRYEDFADPRVEREAVRAFLGRD